jgi:DNA-binding MarR family transcriptional regulator
VTEVAASLGLTRSGATRLVDRAEAERWVRRLPTAMDGRQVSVTPTRTGWAVLPEIRAVLRAVARDTWFGEGGLTADEHVAAAAALQRLDRLARPVHVWRTWNSSRFRSDRWRE